MRIKENKKPSVSPPCSPSDPVLASLALKPVNIFVPSQSGQRKQEHQYENWKMRHQKRRRTNKQKKEMTTIKQTEKSVRALLFADF